VANHKDALKRIRQNAKRRTRNRHYRSMMRTQEKAVRAAVEQGDATTAAEVLPKAVSMIQKVASKGIIHRRQANRRVSRLAKAVAGVSAPEA
jgi:small subunit ribosomal protein S20